MKKSSYLLLLLVFLGGYAPATQAQSWLASAGNLYFTGGNVGIGTSIPSTRLHVIQNGDMPGAIVATGTNPRLWVTDNAHVTLQRQNTNGTGSVGTLTNTSFSLLSNNVERLTINRQGKVGIGTTLPDASVFQLAVEGMVGAREVQVLAQTPWPDFVFRPGYRLRPLAEVATFVAKHQHLPDVPSEAEVKQNGLQLGQMNAKLLQKIEELTLYLLQQEKRLAQLEAELAALRAATQPADKPKAKTETEK
jgi:hypothetical protein